MLVLDNQNFVPLYQQIEEMLRHKIQAGEYQSSMRLPSEAELAAQFGVSTITVKKAVLNLVEQGLLRRKQGKGTFVVSPKQNRDLTQVVSFSESCRLNGTEAGSKTLEQSVVPAPLFVKEALKWPGESCDSYFPTALCGRRSHGGGNQLVPHVLQFSTG